MAYNKHAGRMNKTNYQRMQAQRKAELKRQRAMRADTTRQVGFSNEAIDRLFFALAPGRRISFTGRRYYEHRQNRSDRPGTRI